MLEVYYTHFVALFILVLSNHSHHSMLLLLFICVHVSVCFGVVVCVNYNYINCKYNTWVQKEECHQVTIFSSINIHVVQPGRHMALYIIQDLEISLIFDLFHSIGASITEDKCAILSNLHESNFQQAYFTPARLKEFFLTFWR